MRLLRHIMGDKHLPLARAIGHALGVMVADIGIWLDDVQRHRA